MKNEKGVIQKLSDEAESMYRSLDGYEMKKQMEATFDFLKRQYPEQSGFNLTEVLLTFMTKKEEFQFNNHVKRGYKYLLSTMDDFMKEPERIWQVLEQEKDKKVFFELYNSTFTMDRKENFKSLSMDLLNMLVSYSPLFVHLDRLPNEQRNVCLKILQRKVKNEKKPAIEKEQKEVLVKAIRSMIQELAYFTDLEGIKELHNTKMKKAGLEFLSVEESIPGVDVEGKVFGYDLNKCNTFQLTALYTFYANRLEKIEESLGKGLYYLYIFSLENKLSEKEIFRLDADSIKETWKKFYVLSKTFESRSPKYTGAEPGGSTESYENLTIDDVYNTTYSGLEEDYAKEFNGANLSEEASVFMTTNGFSRHNYYTLKDGMLEEVLVYAIENNVNWGFIEEESGQLLKKMVIIGVDVPGLNMPLRLHYPLEKLRDFAKKYLETSEIPLYIGNEDFLPYGSNVGTQLLLPIDAKDKDRIRKEAKGKSYDDKNGMLKHVECIQWPNQIKKLLSEKTNKTQVSPDYIDVFNGSKRKTQRRTPNVSKNER